MITRQKLIEISSEEFVQHLIKKEVFPQFISRFDEEFWNVCGAENEPPRYVSSAFEWEPSEAKFWSNISSSWQKRLKEIEKTNTIGFGEGDMPVMPTAENPIKYGKSEPYPNYSVGDGEGRRRSEVFCSNHTQWAEKNKYIRDLKGVEVDVYDVLKAFNVTCPALQHLIKKALCVGIRGHKNTKQDLQDILESAQRANEL